jgi:hypothetical protein
MQKKGKKKVLTKNEIVYIISANSMKFRVVFGNNGPKNEKMKEPLVAYGFALLRGMHGFIIDSKSCGVAPRVGLTPTIGTIHNEKPVKPML